MSSVLQKAKAHWAGEKNGTVEVPEWGEKDAPLVVHFVRPSLTEHMQINADIESDRILAMVKLVQMRALDAAGKRLFDDELATLSALRDETSPHLINRISTAIMAATPSKTSLGQAIKN